MKVKNQPSHPAIVEGTGGGKGGGVVRTDEVDVAADLAAVAAVKLRAIEGARPFRDKPEPEVMIEAKVKGAPLLDEGTSRSQPRRRGHQKRAGPGSGGWWRRRGEKRRVEV